MQTAEDRVVTTAGDSDPNTRSRNLWNGHFTAAEWVAIGVAILFWAAVSCLLAPEFGSTDVYLFRDAAINLAHGRGFQTASFEHSLSFVPLLYSSYTPISLWAFAAFALLVGNPQHAAAAFNLLLFVLSIVSAAWLTLPAVPKRKWRVAMLTAFLITLPVGFIGGEAERPETLSFLGLLILVKILVSQRPRLWLAGLVGGLLFLVQPFAGVVAVLFIGLAAVLRSPFTSASAFSLSLAKAGIVSGITFLAPVFITALAFQHQDPQSLQRFKTQATVGGLSRAASTKVSGTEQYASAKVSASSKYKDALRFHQSAGPVGMIGLLGAAIFLSLWAGLVATAKGNLAGTIALFGSGFALLLLPVILFPMQLNYLLLGRALFPLCILLNFAGSWDVIRFRNAPVAMMALNLLFLLPLVSLTLAKRSETKASLEGERVQVAKLKRYLAAHNQEQGVVVVPATHYFIYKTEFNNLFNDSYLSPEHDISQVVAVVNCPAASPYFDAAEKPLNPLLEAAKWNLLDIDNQPNPITLFHKRVMKKNWTWGCAVYTRAK